MVTGLHDAIFQSLNLINDERPDIVVVFGADHVYRMDPEQMWRQHVDGGAGVTVAGIRCRARGCTGVIQTAQDGIGIEAFLEKPADPPGLPGRPDETYASMGNYVFSTEALLDALHTDAANEDSKHDMGGDIVPMLVGQNARRCTTSSPTRCPARTGAERYWRDVGTIDLYAATWTLCDRPRSTSTTTGGRSSRTSPRTRRPSSSTTTATGWGSHRQHRPNGVIVSGASVRESCSPPVHLHSWVTVSGRDHGRRRRPAGRGPTRSSTRTCGSGRASRSA